MEKSIVYSDSDFERVFKNSLDAISSPGKRLQRICQSLFDALRDFEALSNNFEFCSKRSQMPSKLFRSARRCWGAIDDFHVFLEASANLQAFPKRFSDFEMADNTFAL